MGCVESIENGIISIEERIKQVLDADEYFVDNMKTVAMTHVHEQEQILKDFEYMEADPDTRIKLRKFLIQLRSVDFGLMERLFSEVHQGNEFVNPAEDTRPSLQKQRRDYLLNKYKSVLKDSQNVLESKYSIPTISEKPLVPEKKEISAIPTWVRDQTYQKGYVNYSVELLKRIEELQAQWTELYNEFKIKEKDNRKALRQERKDKQAAEVNKWDKWVKEQDKLQDLKNEHKAYKLKKKKREIERAKLQQKLESETKPGETIKMPEEINEAKERNPADWDFNQLWPEHKKTRLTNSQAGKQGPDAKAAEDGEIQFQAKIEAMVIEHNEISGQLNHFGRRFNSAEKKEKNNRLKVIRDEVAKATITTAHPSGIKLTNYNQTFEAQIIDQKIYIEKQFPLGQPQQPAPFFQRLGEDFEDFWYWLKPDQKPPRLDEYEDLSSLENDAKYFRSGLKQIAKGRVALVILGGGQGSRLGKKGPKGMVDIGLNQNKCLYQVFADRIKVIQRLSYLYRPDKAMFRETDSVHVYVMTSPDNDEETRKKFRENLNFGLWKKNVHFFCQGANPATDFDGKIQMADRLKIFMAPDGNGGLYEAIQNANLVEEWKKMGVEYLHVMGIDNLMARPVDPILVGMMKGVKGEYSGLDLVAQYVNALENEKAGRLAFSNNLPHVVEYSEFDEGFDQKSYSKAFTASFGVSVDQIQTFIDYKDSWLVYHKAEKNMDVYFPPSDREVAVALAKGTDMDKQEALEKCMVLQKRGIKYEKFIFDAWKLVHPKRFGLMEVDRETMFAPIKDIQSMQAAVMQQSRQHIAWLKDAGYRFTDDVPVYDQLIDSKGEVIVPGKPATTTTSETKPAVTKVAETKTIDKTPEEKPNEIVKPQEGAEKAVESEVTEQQPKQPVNEPESTQKSTEPVKKEAEQQKATEPPKKEIKVDDLEEDERERPRRKLIEMDFRISLNGEGIPKTTKDYIKSDKNPTPQKPEPPGFFLYYQGKDCKPDLPLGLDVFYRYI